MPVNMLNVPDADVSPQAGYLNRNRGGARQNQDWSTSKVPAKHSTNIFPSN